MMTMKKVLFVLSFFFALGMVSANAQSCGSAKTAAAGKSCCSSKAATAAKADATIQSQVDANGVVTYMRQETDQTGTVRLVSVQFDEAANAFVNVAPKGEAATEGMVKKSCGTSVTGAKSCCASGKAEAKSCCTTKKEQ
jgi:hypothetical protein